MKLARKTIVVTGGSSGLGLELCRQLVARGNTVLAVGRNATKLSAIRSEVSGLLTFAADIADPAQRVGLLDHVRSELPACDMLINNAGIMRSADFSRSDAGEEAGAEIAVNLLAPIQLIAMFVPLLRGRPDACIVNVSSGLAYAPFPLAPVYSATKAALHSFSQSLRIQLQTNGIRVVEIIPPTLDTPMISDEFRAAMRGQRMETVQRVASSALRRIEAGDTEIALGGSAMLRVLSRVAPGLLSRQMASMYRRARVS